MKPMLEEMAGGPGSGTGRADDRRPACPPGFEATDRRPGRRHREPLTTAASERDANLLPLRVAAYFSGLFTAERRPDHLVGHAVNGHDLGGRPMAAGCVQYRAPAGGSRVLVAPKACLLSVCGGVIHPLPVHLLPWSDVRSFKYRLLT